MAPPVSWFFMGGGRWNELTAEDSAALESSFQATSLASSFGFKGGSAASVTSVRLGPNKAQYTIDFAKMEQLNPVTGKIRTLRRGHGEEAKSFTAAAGSPWSVGDPAECYSVSQGKWLKAKVTVVEEKAITVMYTAPNGSQVMKQLPVGHEHLRRSAADTGVATVASSGYPQRSAAVAAPGGVQSFPREAPEAALKDIPFIGSKPTATIQADTLQRLRRLIRHGDVQGAKRTLQRAELLKISAEELANEKAQLKALEAQGEFALLLPRTGGA
eukprot:TRINITY_DN69827_c0_g1_i1.p1 TRINITY_DN69827_c0_g1~~TRINITY_DN69827_c0_g1_i1.p1  ORF type:complete len:272 (+),score=62.93 TRINITY_DN69827_c0_g1_i1:33-848(+)